MGHISGRNTERKGYTVMEHMEADAYSRPSASSGDAKSGRTSTSPMIEQYE